MTQEDKQLLFKDLCMRLPYGVKFNYGGYSRFDYTLEIMTSTSINDDFPIGDCKPYLRPLFSMTEEERIAYLNACDNEMEENVLVQPRYSGIDWLNEHHFDYRGLIEKGLAIEVTEENNHYVCH